MSNGVPEGWARIRLDELLAPGGLFDGPFGSNLKTGDYTNTGIRVIRLENLANLRFVADKATYISAAKYSGLTKHTVGEGDIIVGSFIDGAVRVCILPSLPTKAIAKADCFTIRTRDEVVDRRFVAYQLGSAAIRDAFVESSHGATRPRIATKQLRECELAIAPLAEQHRIIERLNVLFEHLDRAATRVTRIARLLGGPDAPTFRADHLRQALLSKAFAGELVPTEAELARAEDRDYETAEALLARIKSGRADGKKSTAVEDKPKGLRQNRKKASPRRLRAGRR